MDQIDIFDLEYNMGTFAVSDIEGLSPMKQAEILINRMEYSQTLFSMEERNFLVNLSYQFADIRQTKEFAETIAEEGFGATYGGIIEKYRDWMDTELQYLPDNSINLSNMIKYGYSDRKMLPINKERALELFDDGELIYFLNEDNSETLPESRDEVVQHEGIFGIEREKWNVRLEWQQESSELEVSQEDTLIFQGEDNFEIYQLKHDEGLHYHRFENLESLARHGLTVESTNYDLMYTAPLSGSDTLDDIFERFNLYRPEDFTGHSLSVSDIVIMQRNGEITAHYVDSFGFQ